MTPFFTEAPPPSAVAAPMPVPATLPFVCFYHYPVTIVYTVELVGQGQDGLVRDQVDAHKHLNWHRDAYTRDDIIEPGLLQRVKTITTHEKVRRYVPTTDCRLESWDGRTLVIPETGNNGFFAGFAPTLMDAMTFVASGDERGLVKPW
jgi:hypothetical protein